MTSPADLSPSIDEPAATTRRDFMLVAATAFVAVGSAAALWPLIGQLAPDAAERALATIEVDLSPIRPGEAITVMWRGKPLFVRRRTPAEITAAEAVVPATLKDPRARNAALREDAPASDENRVKAGKAEWLVLVGVCTHLGCVPQGQRPGSTRGTYGGWFCSCHGSEYDTSGRIRQGPAPENLAVPPYYFMNDTRVLIGDTAPRLPSA